MAYKINGSTVIDDNRNLFVNSLNINGNGVATLDASGLVPSSQLPSYVDDVLEYNNLASFPAIGETGKIYVAKDTNKTYRWSGSVYIQIYSGAVDSVAGKTGAVTLTSSDVGLGNVTNESKTTMFTSPTFTGTVTLPSTTSIGTISSTELGYIDGVTSNIQTQLNSKNPNLVSGTNIKTINGSTILESGNINLVDLTTNQTIAGVKTFSSSPIVPTPTTGTQVANKTYTDGKVSKTEVAYNVDTSSFIPNTLASGAIIERGSNTNGEYIKFADGTLICKNILNGSEQAIQDLYGSIFVGIRSWIYPYTFVDVPYRSLNISYNNQAPWCEASVSTNTIAYFYIYDIAARGSGIYMDFSYLAIGRWK
jgi:hypothetical protein